MLRTGWLNESTCFVQALVHTQILTALSRKMLRHFACNFGALRYRILQILKECHNLKILWNLKIFQIRNIPLRSALNWHAK
jgi:hypothetical protein